MKKVFSMNTLKLKPLILIGRGRFISVLVWGLFILLLAGGCGKTQKTTPAAKTVGKTVELTLDFGDGRKKDFNIPWHEKMTVLDAIQAASKLPKSFTFEMKGKGATAFIEQFDGVKNQGGGEDMKNWLLWVNGEYAKRGAGILELNPSDVVLWRFSKKPLDIE